MKDNERYEKKIYRVEVYQKDETKNYVASKEFSLKDLLDEMENED